MTLTLTSKFLNRLDPWHQRMNFLDESLSKDVWTDKYKSEEDKDIFDMCWRVAKAINGHEKSSTPNNPNVEDAYYAMIAGLWIPAGRTLAGAGTAKRVTLINCFVNETIQDRMEHIMDCMKYTALTMQQGGGMGTDFSPIRPEGAWLFRTHSRASGPLPFMDQMNSGSKTIRSAGERRGAMIGTLCDTHPDLPAYIIAKREAGRLQEFNVSVLISDAFMDAVAEDEEWLLYFSVPPASRSPRKLTDLDTLETHIAFDTPSEMEKYDFIDNEGVQQYVYSVWRARDLDDLITENTYKWSEPGKIFIDRINQLNNLSHVEEIRCTNPCGEQPLPPHGACDLGHVNLARMVKFPFTEKACFNWDLLDEIATIGHRFLDNVLDVTGYPLEQQRAESMYKRRIGMGYTGLADAMMQLRIRYGSAKSVEFADNVTQALAMASYKTNIELAIEKGPCPAMTPEMIAKHKVTEGTNFISQRLPESMKDDIRRVGLRNGVGLTIAPTGTTSVVFGNLDGSGCECAFAHSYNRRVRIPVAGKSDEYRVYKDVKGYTHRLWALVNGDDVDYPGYFVTAQDLGVEEHIVVQAAIQRWIDASVSKTVNCPEEMNYEAFRKVYELAYNMGCKGCTTYRPSDVRGSILSIGDAVQQNQLSASSDAFQITKRPFELSGKTYQVKWPSRVASLYMTLNKDEAGNPAEILIASKDASNFEWVTALTLMITAIFKKGGDTSFVADELKQIKALNDFAWIDGQMMPSLPAYIGTLLDRHLYTKTVEIKEEPEKMVQQANDPKIGDICPSCQMLTLVRQEGCKKCVSCGWSSC